MVEYIFTAMFVILLIVFSIGSVYLNIEKWKKKSHGE
jgi:hypothetical protein